jgi:uncharacterized membrane protein (UPF0127 family)
MTRVDRRMRTVLIAAFLAVALAFVPHALGAELPVRSLAIGKHKLVAEVAATPEQRSTGLMHRFSLRPDHGMLFVFERPERLSFWMRNTYIPLSIAFIGADGRIVNIEDMAPQTESSHWSRAPALYALEMRKGWFAERGIRAGDAVAGLPAPAGSR